MTAQMKKAEPLITATEGNEHNCLNFSLTAEEHETDFLKFKEIIGMIAHNFNNALVVITGNIELLKMGLLDTGNMDKFVDPIYNSAHRMANLTDQLLAYTREGNYQPVKVSLSAFVKETLPLIRHKIDSLIPVETDLPGDIANVNVDPTQMKMVLFALVTNAVEAIESAGRIRISARNLPSPRAGSNVRLTIEDNGKGMDEETRNRIFEPFFTTNFQGRGLSMAAVYGIEKNHGK